ncbi:hypothetical protein O181_014510 [Austropuccinia psidii MF-1]|uniref:Nucleoporin Nup188 N-terminal subdomain III domain-containing protein n=1 Tax=Austropuccinia psidii MF-1 TaxID=1389203 RepID=A0A9Q3C1Z9_9BASI|nr:hypothetical protein [Austropuccinia psidii MF-1]
MVQIRSQNLALISNPIQLINQALAGSIEQKTSSSQSLPNLLKLHEDKFKKCYDPYPPSSSRSRDIINSGKAILKDGHVVTLSAQQKENVFRISDTFNLDEIESLIIWHQFVHLHQLPQIHSNELAVSDQESTASKCLNQSIDQEMMDKLTAFYFEERRSALVAVASMLHIEDNESCPIFGLCLEFLNSIITPDTPSLMLQMFSKRTKTQLPESVRASPRQSSFWTQQLVYEEKLLLEVVFLLLYDRVKADVTHYLSVLTVLKETSWGQNQSCMSYFDEETLLMNKNVSNLLTLIGLQVSHIEDVCSNQFSLAPEPYSDQELINPIKLKEIYDLQLELLEHQPQQAAPVALAWTFILHKLTSIYSENPIPESHQEFLHLILPTHGNLNSITQDDESNPEIENMPLYQRWARHILSNECELFANLSQLVNSVYCASTSKRFGTPDNNALGYLVTVRVLLSAIPIFFRLSYFNSQQFEDVINLFGLLFRLDAQNDIASDFWKAVRGELADVNDMDLPLATGEAEYLATAQGRFPINFALFTKLCRSVSGFSETRQLGTSTAQAFCVESLVEYADQLVTLTEAIQSPQSALLPLAFEPTLPPPDVNSNDIDSSDTQGWVKATRPIWISPGLQIPKATIGRIVSGADHKPVVVCWRYTWSAWQYWGSLLLHCAGCHGDLNLQNAQDDVFGASPISNSSWAKGKLDDDSLVDVLEIVTSVFECRPDIGAELISRMVGEVSHQTFIQAIFNIIGNSAEVTTNQSSQVIQSALRLVSSLLPIFPEVVWTLIRGFHHLFPILSKKPAWNIVESTGPIVRLERLAGEYGITLAVLDLAQMLVLEATTSGLITNQTFADIKAEVLLRALNWICEDIWPGFQNWKYCRLEDKFKIATKCCTIFNLIASDGLKTHLHLCQTKTDPVASRLIQTFSEWFLTSPTAITLNPIISIITTDKSVIEVLRKSNRHVELEAFVESLSNSLSLAKNILSLRSCHLPIGQPSLLERLLLAQSYRKVSSGHGIKDSSRQTALPFLAQWCLDGSDPTIAQNACHVFALLCTLSRDWSSDWSSISLGFGDPANMSRFLHEAARRGSEIEDFNDSELRSTFWNLLAVIIETQPSLAAILVTGNTFLPGLTSRPVSTSRSKTPFQLGIETFVKCFENNDALNILVGSSVLYFLYTIYTRFDGFTSVLKQTMEEQAFIDRVVNISTSLVAPPSLLLDMPNTLLRPMGSSSLKDESPGMVEEIQVKHFCNKLICKAYSTRILTVLLQLESHQLTDSQDLPAKRIVEKALLEDLQKTPTRLNELICSAIESSADPALQSQAFREIMNRFPKLDLDTYRRVEVVLSYEKLGLYGKNFVYDYELIQCRIESIDISAAIVDEVLKNLVAINWNLSTVDAQLEVTRAWEVLLEVAFQQKNVALQLGKQLSETLLQSANIVASENRGGHFMLNIHSVRISMLLTLLQTLPVNAETTTTTIKLLENIKNLGSSEHFPIADSIKQRTKTTWHTNYFKLLYLVLRRCAPIDASKLSDEQRHMMINLIETLLRSSISILETVLTLALLSSDTNYAEDLDLSVSIFNELINSPVRPPIMNWAHRIHDLCQPAFNLFTQQVISDDQEPKFAEHIIRLCMSLALDERLAEYMASEGLINVLLNNSLTHRASHGLIEPISSPRSLERSPIHRLWCSILALVVSLANTLCYSQIFMLDEIGSFARLYSPQLMRALASISGLDGVSRGTYGLRLTLAGLEEAELVSDLLVVISSKPIGHPILTLPEDYRCTLLAALQTLAHSLNHPNSTSKWLEDDTSWKNGRLMSQSLNRPGSNDTVVISNSHNLAHHVQEALLHMLQISRNILQTLISYTRAFNVLTRDITEWAIEYAVITPTRSIAGGDPATVGTLFELAETSLDIYRVASTNPSTTSTRSNLDDIDCVSVSDVSATVLECSLLLASTQLALWLCSTVHHNNPMNPGSSGIHQNPNLVRDNDMTGQVQVASFLSTSPRLKREILSDLAPDLIASIDKALSTSTLVASRANPSDLTKTARVITNFRQSVTSKKRPFVLSSSASSGKNDPVDLSRSNKETQKHGVVETLSLLKSFVEKFLVVL